MQPVELIRTVSDRLVDSEPGYENTTWTRSQLLNAFNWAMSTIADLRPQVFARPARVTLGAGGMTEVQDCDRLSPPFILLDRKGQFVRDLVPGRVRGALRTRSMCGGKEAGPYYFTQLSDASFEVFPPLGDNEQGWQVEGLCLATPHACSEEDEIQLPRYLVSATEELMMYYALTYEVDSQTETAAAASHLKLGLSLVGSTEDKQHANG